MPFLRKYNTLTVTGTTAIRIPIIKRGVVDFAVSADWTPAAGDVKIAVDGAAAANVTNLPTAVAMGNGAYWEFILTAAELTCKSCVVTVADSATKAVEDQAFIVETFGHASAMYQADFSAANLPANVVQISGDAQSATDLKDFADAGYDPATNKVQGVVLVDTTTTNSDMRGTDNAALAATALSTAVWTSTIAGRIDAAVSTRLAPLVAGRNISVAATTGAVELDSAVGTQITNIENASGYLLAVLAGACADPQTASETYAITVFGSTFTVDMAGQTSTGTRTAPTLTKA
jgi:hypothetical protein